jgi:hypothetical protein
MGQGTILSKQADGAGINISCCDGTVYARVTTKWKGGWEYEHKYSGDSGQQNKSLE